MRGKIEAGPFGLNARFYVERGWAPIPVHEHSKECAVVGYTGRDGKYPTSEQVGKWESEYNHSNIAIRLPRDIIGIDVDDYGTKRGYDTLMNLEKDLGELPRTYVITSRDDGQSGIRLFRVPKNKTWKGVAGLGIDILTWYHRYAVVEPSVHPETAREYKWYHEEKDGSYRESQCPSYLYDSIPDLPEDWQAYLHHAQVGNKSGKMGRDAIKDWLKDFGAGDPCSMMKDTAALWIAAVMDAGDGGGAHEAMISGVHALLGDAAVGHTGMYDELQLLQDVFLGAISSRRSASDAASEWWRAIAGAVREYYGKPRPASDPCTDIDNFTFIPSPGAKMLTDEVLKQRTREMAEWTRKSAHMAVAPLAIRGNDFMDIEYPPVRVVIENLLPYDGNTLLVAQRKAGKTTLVHNLLRNMVDGDEFLDNWAVKRFEKNKTIALLDFEMIPGMLQEWLRAQNISERGLKRINVFSFRGRASSFDIKSDTNRERWIETFRAANVGYLMLDCLAPAMYANDLNEDVNADMGLFLSLMDEIAAESGIAGILASHHMGHSGERGRGASRLRDWPETEIHLVLDGQGEDDDGRLRPRAMRYLAGEGRLGAFDEVQLNYEEETRHLWWDGGGSRKSEAINAAKPEVLAYIARTPGCSKNAIATDVTGFAKPAKERAIQSMLDDKQICMHHGPNRSHTLWTVDRCPNPDEHVNRLNLK